MTRVEGVYLRVFFVMVFFGLTIGDDAQPRHVKQMKVDLLGKGDFRRIQDAIDSVPSDSKKRVLIMVEPGIYKEKVTVPADKTFITLRGRKNNASVITWDDGGDIHESPTVSVFASNFIGHYLTIQNTHGPGAKAVALRVTGDTASFKSCRILSYQDTLLDEEGTHHYSNCYIEGAIDFIFGNAASIFKNCPFAFSFARKLGNNSTKQKIIRRKYRVFLHWRQDHRYQNLHSRQAMGVLILEWCLHILTCPKQFYPKDGMIGGSQLHAAQFIMGNTNAMDQGQTDQREFGGHAVSQRKELHCF
ncbi:hypothetical protein Ancab_003968 [Ancistrocladus abbreviatus]